MQGLEADNLEGKPFCEWCADMETSHPQFLYWSKTLKLEILFLHALYASTRCSHRYHFPGLWRHSLYSISAQATSGRQASGCRITPNSLNAHTRQCRGTGNFLPRELIFLKTGGVFCGVDSNKAELSVSCFSNRIYCDN